MTIKARNDKDIKKSSFAEDVYVLKKFCFLKILLQLAPNKELCDEGNSNKTILIHLCDYLTIFFISCQECF